ncbi:hypothetical protein DBR06_SOUSAS3010013, partial [Sousa chinensis]
PIITVANKNPPEHCNRPGSKLGLSNSKSITCYLNIYQVVPCNHLPL